MKKEDLSAAISGIDIKFISEAEKCDMKAIKTYKNKGSLFVIAAVIICLVLSITAFAGVTLTGWTPTISFFDESGNKTQVNVSEEGFFKELPENLPVPKENEPKMTMTKSQIEELLGFSILSSVLSDENTLYYYDAIRNHKNNSVARVDIWCPMLISESITKHIDMSVQILSEDAEQGFIEAFKEGTDAAGGKKYLENYCAKESAFNAVIYTYEEVPSMLIATFVYEDVYYHIQSENYSIEEFKAVLDTLEITE